MLKMSDKTSWLVDEVASFTLTLNHTVEQADGKRSKSTQEFKFNATTSLKTFWGTVSILSNILKYLKYFEIYIY